MLPDRVKVEYSIRLLPFQLRQVCSWKWYEYSILLLPFLMKAMVRVQHSAAPIPVEAGLLLEMVR